MKGLIMEIGNQIQLLLRVKRPTLNERVKFKGSEGLVLFRAYANANPLSIVVYNAMYWLPCTVRLGLGFGCN